MQFDQIQDQYLGCIFMFHFVSFCFTISIHSEFYSSHIHTHTQLFMMVFNFYHMQEVVVVGRVKQPPNLHHRQDWLGRSTVARFNAKKAFPVLPWEILHSASLCVEVGERSLMMWCWLSMWSLSCQQLLASLPP